MPCVLNHSSSPGDVAKPHEKFVSISFCVFSKHGWSVRGECAGHSRECESRRRPLQPMDCRLSNRHTGPGALVILASPFLDNNGSSHPPEPAHPRRPSFSPFHLGTQNDTLLIEPPYSLELFNGIKRPNARMNLPPAPAQNRGNLKQIKKGWLLPLPIQRLV